MNGSEDSRTAGGQHASPSAVDSANTGRPPLTGRVHYLLGGTLPPAYNAWVSHDLTGPGWRVRQAMRPLLLLLPFAVVFALLPGQPAVRAVAVGFILLAGLGLGFATGNYFRNRRLEQHGFPPVSSPPDDPADAE
ncbi:conserved hypothetical protein [Frankia sp. AiPs1]|uniref:DUF5313 family protein n=1 Tax=Frankia sp. AiPa1 TaxID=573492 RepID=UPI00202B2122|nr:DUF5313 family protein [Frankia sp. AiPa1]MCL9757711.1 DUF5313 domain-containing protein [Frankia sp. AiPa1]